jgi:hypothetical protein
VRTHETGSRHPLTEGVSTVTTEYEQRRQRARQRLASALDPQTDAERGTVNYVADVAPNQLGVLIGMIDRVAKAARAEGYDRGWHEGIEYAKGRRL